MSQQSNSDLSRNEQIEVIADSAYKAIASAFPVCSFSDEFYFFPQVVLPNRDWRVWDDFSESRVASIAGDLQGFERDLLAVDSEGMSTDDLIDVELMQQVLKTLREQLSMVTPHQSQPTFHLTVLAAGLAEALASSDSGAWDARVLAVPAFLDRAAGCLKQAPELFHRLGVDMLTDLQSWVGCLQADGYDVGALPADLRKFRAAMQNVKIVENYQLPEALLEHLVKEHIGCDVGVDALWLLLQEELQAMEEILAAETGCLAPGKTWVAAEQQIPFVVASGKGLLELYRRELKLLEAHCQQHGLSCAVDSGASLGLAAMPGYLAAIRASDAYAAMPGYPPRGGVFFVMEQRRSRDNQPGRSLEYRMTAAHEAWPGHHLLDSCRWALSRPLRRPIESPLFYEGWACLAEELMFLSGYFDDPWDRFLLAKRRAERAARGLIDLGLQSGRMTIGEAVALLVRVGYRPEVASSVVPKYLLRPGYQVCYTFGLKQGLSLLEKFGKQDIGCFARAVLMEGEIGFARLEKVLSAKR